MALLADVQLMLTYVRQPTAQGFDDSLSLELSDDVKAEPLRHRALEEVHLRGVGFEPSIGTLKYTLAETEAGQESDEPASRFYKKDGSRLYTADMADVVAIGKDLVSKVESILESRWLADVSVQGLEYFFPANTKNFAEFPFTPYFHTSYTDTHGFKEWLYPKQDRPLKKSA